MPRKVRVYIASPYSNGDKELLVKLHLDVAYNLLKNGFNPYAPLYNHYIQKDHPDVDKDFPWLELDRDWLYMCDIAVRLHFKDKNDIEIVSPGADIEEQMCKDAGIPMFHFDTIEEMNRVMETFDKFTM